MKKHPELTSINGKICSKCNIDKPKNSFHNDKYKKDCKNSIFKECVKVSTINYNSKDRELSTDYIKHVLDTKHIECTTCNKIIYKTNWSKHVKTLIHNERHSN